MSQEYAYLPEKESSATFAASFSISLSSDLSTKGPDLLCSTSDEAARTSLQEFIAAKSISHAAELDCILGGMVTYYELKKATETYLRVEKMV
jgi:hypothetical protein